MSRRRRRSTTKRVIKSLSDLTSDEMWELELGPRSCRGSHCDRAGHHLPQEVGLVLDDPEHQDSTALHVQRDGSYRRKPLAKCSEWSTPEERRTAWFACRDELLSMCAAGARPWAWFAVEAHEVPLNEATWLAEQDELSASEVGEILALADRELKANNGSHRYIEAARIIRTRHNVT